MNPFETVASSPGEPEPGARTRRGVLGLIAGALAPLLAPGASKADTAAARRRRRKKDPADPSAVLLEPFTFADLATVGMSKIDVINHFRAYERPEIGQVKCVWFNDECYANPYLGDGRVKCVDPEYKSSVRKRIDSITYRPSRFTQPTSRVLASLYTINRSDEPANKQVSVSGSQAEETSWSTSITNSWTVSSSVSIKEIFEIGGEFNQQVTVGQGGSKRQERSFSTSVEAPVPPKSRKKISLVAVSKTEIIDFDAPFSVTGVVGIVFTKNDSEFRTYFESPVRFLPKTTGTFQGTLQFAGVFETTADIGPAEPLDG